MPGEGEGEGGRVPQAGVRGPELRPRPALRAAGLHAGGRRGAGVRPGGLMGARPSATGSRSRRGAP